MRYYTQYRGAGDRWRTFSFGLSLKEAIKISGFFEHADKTRVIDEHNNVVNVNPLMSR